ncbi:hypothetical protein BDK51DRAFT_24039 [Blyttiomyces helicus]|uniref:Uncharacterized protein n=1 Tax=Blyttiomyces helicus TaxID=388810 RepID=A0A4P9WPC3_9FUNG|nr:hypothetical protein BDK51DRAFT_24039 [Blyttiomyces helicus]|eukprot:RKO93973.1 hypothetical protein BDK51DRAFT_24039 [Blyttiomyces helicus]
MSHGLPAICLRTAYSWLQKMGLEAKEYRKAVYFDGHERKDVLEYRNKVYLPAITAVEPLLAEYKGKEMDVVRQLTLNWEREHVPIFDNESICYHNNSGRLEWVRRGEVTLREEGQGLDLHS